MNKKDINKLKCYVLIVSEKFPTTHERAGEPTGFADKILRGEKIHTIRENLDFWSSKAIAIEEGKAYLSIRKWTGIPYRSPQEEICQVHSENFGYEYALPFNKPNRYLMIGINQAVHSLRTVSENDGLSIEDFKEWFRKSRASTFIVLHFTPFRYSNK